MTPHRFEQVLRHTRQTHNRMLGLCYALLCLIWAAIAFGLLGAFTAIPKWEPHLLFWLGTGLKLSWLGGAITLAWRMSRRRMNLFRAARYLDETGNDPADTFRNALELRRENGPLVERVLTQADLRATEFAIPVRIPQLRETWPRALALTLAMIAFALIAPRTFAETVSGMTQLLPPTVHHKTTVEVKPGNVSILRGHSLTVEASNPELNAEHRLFYRTDKTWREYPMPNAKKLFPRVDETFDYYVKTPWAVSDTFRVTVYDEPTVKNLTLRFEYPAYTGLKPVTEENSTGNVKALRNTRVLVRMEANNPVEKAQLVFDSGAAPEMSQLGRTSAEAAFTVTRDDRYHIRLVDMLGNESQPLLKTIEMVPDLPPEIRIAYPGRDTVLTQNMLLPLTFVATDDFGLHDLILHYQVNDGTETTVSIADRIPGTTFEHDWTFDLHSLSLLPGDRVTYWAEINDNSPENQRSFSRHYTARFPSIEEIYKEIEQEQDKSHDQLAENSEQSKDLNKDFEEKRRELMKKDQPDWQDKKDLQELMNRQDKLNNQVQQLAQDYQDLIQKVQQNNAVSDETIQKMQKIQELMQEITSDDLQKAMEQMQQAMQNMDPDVLKRAMDNMKFSMEDFQKKLDRTIDLLQQIKKEQGLQKAQEIAEEMQQMQEDLLKRTEAAKDTRSLTDEQQAISDRLQSLQDQLQQSEQSLDPTQDAAVKQMMDEMREQMQQDNLASDLNQSQQNLSQNQPSQSLQNQQSALQKMQGMNARLQKMRDTMNQGSSMQMGQGLQEAIKRLLAFSDMHERSKNSYVQDPFAILNDQLAIFEGVQMTIQKLYSVPMMSLVVLPKFMLDANFTSLTYKDLFSDINDNKLGQIPKYLNDIQKGLNLMAYDLILSAQNMSSSSGSSGMQMMMQQLQSMSDQQMAMNMMAQQMMQQMQQGGGRMTNDMRSQMQRMAGDEQQLADNLRRMLQTNPESQQQAGTLSQAADELEQIAKQLRQNRMSQDLVDHQEQILSRLLDAQKSIHKREFSKERKAERSDHESWDTPQETQMKFEEMRKKALLNPDVKSYPKEYQDIIKEYMKRLNGSSTQP